MSITPHRTRIRESRTSRPILMIHTTTGPRSTTRGPVVYMSPRSSTTLTSHTTRYRITTRPPITPTRS